MGAKERSEGLGAANPPSHFAVARVTGQMTPRTPSCRKRALAETNFITHDFDADGRDRTMARV